MFTHVHLGWTSWVHASAKCKSVFCLFCVVFCSSAPERSILLKIERSQIVISHLGCDLISVIWTSHILRSCGKNSQ